MKNPNKYLRKAYLRDLANIGCPIWDKRVPADFTTPALYVLFTDIAKTETDRTKCDKGFAVAIQLDLIYRGERGYADSAIIDDLEERITNIITPNVQADINLQPEFICYNTFLDQNVDMPMETPEETILRRVLRFRHIIGQSDQDV